MRPQHPAALIVLLGSLPGLSTQTYAEDFAALASKATAARESHRLAEAITLYRRAVAARPSWTEGWFYLGTLLYDRNEYAHAARAFREVVKHDARNGTALVMLGLCEFQVGQDEDALRHISAGRKLEIPVDEQFRQVALYHEALLLHRRKRFDGARERLHMLCAAGAATPEAVRTLGMVALRLPAGPGKRVDPVVDRIGAAQCLAGRREFVEARRAFSAVVREVPDFPDIHYAFGRFLIESGDADAGIEELKEEIKRNSRHTLARLQIAAALYKVDSPAGLQWAEQAVRLEPELPIGRYLLGLLLLDMDDHARAIPELEKAVQSMPQQAQIYLALGSAYSRAGRADDAARARAQFQKWKAQSEQDSLLPEAR